LLVTGAVSGREKASADVTAQVQCLGANGRTARTARTGVLGELRHLEGLRNRSAVLGGLRQREELGSWENLGNFKELKELWDNATPETQED